MMGTIDLRVAVLWILGNLADSTTTYFLVINGPASEANPLFAWLFHEYGFMPATIVKFVGVILIAGAVTLERDKRIDWAFIAVTAFIWVVAISSLLAILFPNLQNFRLF